MNRPAAPTSLARGLKSARRRSLSSSTPLALWGGTTHPYENQKIPISPVAGTNISIPSPNADPTRISRLHHAHLQKLLDLTAASVSGLETSWDSRRKAAVPPLPSQMPASSRSQKQKQKSQRHSLSEPPLFRTDGPLTPYPIELDSGEVLEPTHATLVRVLDRAGEEKHIVVAEVEGESGKKRRVLLAVDLEGYERAADGESRQLPVARQVSAEDVYMTNGLEPPKA